MNGRQPNEYFQFEFNHCGRVWHGLVVNSRCRTCGKMFKTPYKALVKRAESKEEFIAKFSEVFK